MSLFEKIMAHRGHEIEAVDYGNEHVAVNAAIECVDCGEVIVDEDNPDITWENAPHERRQPSDEVIARVMGHKEDKVEDQDTYRIVRFYRDEDKPKEIIEEGVSLEYAKGHCNAPETSGDGWFDGFEKE